MTGPHIGEDAELYALGSLDDDARAAVDAHVAVCESCRRRLGEAEETVLALEREERIAPFVPLPLALRRPAPSWLAALAVAAAFALGFLWPRPPAALDDAHLAMLDSHFSHAQFQGNGPLAKVLYPRDRSWYYVIVEGSHAYTVSGSDGARTVPIGTTSPHGKTSELFVPHAARYDRIELREGSALVETAQIR